MNTPDQQAFEVVPPAGKDKPADGIPLPSPAPQAAPAAVVTDDDTAAASDAVVDERQRKTEEIRVRRPISWSVRMGVLAGLILVATVTIGFYTSLSTSVRGSLASVSTPDLSTVDGLRHWAKDQQTWLNGTLLPDQQAQWKEIDALKAEVASLKSHQMAAKSGNDDRAITWLIIIMVVEAIALAALALAFIRFRFNKRRAAPDEA